jgi:AcrR family transcriptional regulator
MARMADGGRKPDAARTRADILDAARAEFTDHGLSGARVDAIAEKTRTTKRMIYYYFGSKEGLYAAVLEQAYSAIRTDEASLCLDALVPDEALRRVIEFTFDYHEDHADFVRLVAVENIHQGQYVTQIKAIKTVNEIGLKTLDEILREGFARGIFRRRSEALDIHLMISGLCFHRVSNRYTFEAAFGCDLSAEDIRSRHRRMMVDAVLGYLKQGE